VAYQTADHAHKLRQVASAAGFLEADEKYSTISVAAATRAE